MQIAGDMSPDGAQGEDLGQIPRSNLNPRSLPKRDTSALCPKLGRATRLHVKGAVSLMTYPLSAIQYEKNLSGR